MGCPAQSSFKLTTTVLLVKFLLIVRAGVLRNIDHQCNHLVGRLHDDVLYNVQLDPGHIIKKRSADQPLRIHIHYDASIDELPLNHQQVIKVYVKEAVDFWQSALKIRPSQTQLRLRRMCKMGTKYEAQVAYCVKGCREITTCGIIRIPEKHLDGCMYYIDTNRTFVTTPPSNEGIDADYILYVASLPSPKCSNGETIAFAAHCQQEAALDRPVAGYCSICPNIITTSKHHSQQLLSTIKHEILHALGFTAGLYAFYRDSNGEPLTERNSFTGKPTEFDQLSQIFKASSSTVQKVVRPSWEQITGITEKTINMMVTPRVTEEVRRHFNCSTLEGAELEDQGGDGTALTHWEKRVFENEAMTGTYTHNSIFSRITFALMEDTGWYKADYSKAGSLEWGKDLGCEFVQNSCYHWISTRQLQKESIQPFCNVAKRGEMWTDCSQNRKSVMICNLVEHQKPLSGRHQYFHLLPGVPQESISKYGGSVILADYCPFLQELNWINEQNVSDRGSNCQDPANNIKDARNNFFGETYGNGSLCFEHSSKWYLHECNIVRSPQHSGSACYQYSCSRDGLRVHVQNKTYSCYKKNQVLALDFKSDVYYHQGSLVCPSCLEICPHQGVPCPTEKEPPPIKRVKIDQAALCGSGKNRLVYAALLLGILLATGLNH